MSPVVALATLLMAAGPSKTAEAPAEAVELARLLFPKGTWDQDIARAAEQLRTLVPTMVAFQANRTVAEINDQSGQELKIAVDDALKELLPAYEEIVGIQAATLGRHFTRDELKELADFYRGRTGSKMAAFQPTLSRDLVKELENRVGTKMLEIVERLGRRFQLVKPKAAGGAVPVDK